MYSLNCRFNSNTLVDIANGRRIPQCRTAVADTAARLPRTNLVESTFRVVHGHQDMSGSHNPAWDAAMAAPPATGQLSTPCAALE